MAITYEMSFKKEFGQLFFTPPTRKHVKVEIDFSRSEALQCVKRLRLVQQMTHEIKKAGMKLQLDIRTNLAPISRFFVSPLYKICGLQPTRYIPTCMGSKAIQN